MSHSSAQHWQNLYQQTPLADIPFHFANLRNSPFLLRYLATILRFCPPGSRTLETGIGTGFGAIWLSQRGVQAEGLDYAPAIVERASQINNLLGGQASFRVGDLFQLYSPDTPRYRVIHHQGVLEHFTAPQIQSALAQQVALADRVVFSVPSVYYPFAPEFGDERLLPLEEWERLLAPFDVLDLRYYGDPQHGEREHILCVLAGQPLAAVQSLFSVPDYPPGISAIVHTRNEARHLAACLQTLQGWTDEIIVCDMESEDETVAIARQFTDNILFHPRIPNFDRARNVSALRAKYRWVFYLDADERVPPGLGAALREMTQQPEETFAAVLVPFQHHYSGHWLRCLYPGYTAPRLFRNGRFRFNARLHSGAQVDGPIVRFPANNPALALTHYSYDSLHHYLDKLNRYTDGEALNMHRDGQPFHWQNALRHFVNDLGSYYEQMGAHQDGVHGFLYAFHSAFYRFEQHAKLYEHRFHQGQLQPAEQSVPASVEQMLEFALHVAREKPLPQAPQIHLQSTSDAAGLVWSGPLLDPSGYGEESRHLLWAMAEAGVSVAAQPLPWSADRADLTPEEQTALETLCQRPALPGFVHVTHNFAPAFTRHPNARLAIGRTVFETDRLPLSWVQACQQMDEIWVPTEFNRQTFTDAGVDPSKLVVLPECFDPAPYHQAAPPTALTNQIREENRFQFLTIFDWTLHKGWDTLLLGFLEAFQDRSDVGLVLKVWSTMGYSAETIQAQAAKLVKDKLGYDLLSDPRVRFVSERLPRAELLSLYQACDAFVLPSRGEGWGRPYMEAMACGLPTIGTNWSGNTAFMNEQNSYLLDYALTAVPEEGWKEIVTYQGHRWAEPDKGHLVQTLRHVVDNREEAKAKGKQAQQEISAKFNRKTVGKLLAAEVARLEALSQPRTLLTVTKADDLDSLVATEQAKATAKSKQTAKGRADKRAPVKAAAETQQPKVSEETTPKPVQELSFLPVSIRWEGDLFQWQSLAHVNRELCLALQQTGQVELSCLPIQPPQFTPHDDPRFQPLGDRLFAPLSQSANVHIRHFFPPRFETPQEGHFVLIQPWEYGFLPERWIQPIQEKVQEVWCYSQYVKEVYKASGIPEEKLHVVPLGVDTQVFRPQGLPYLFTHEPGAPGVASDIEGRFVFLFVGGTLDRKGIDILLEAYLKGFSAYDPVCLVIKDTGTNTVYRGQNARERILELAHDPTRPPIVYLEQDLPAFQMAQLYRSAHCLVQPYRGEGFCLPALEGMACGLPVLAPQGGPTDDFIDESVGWRLPAAHKSYGNGRIGEWDCVGPTWAFEISPETLARQMRAVFHAIEEAKRRGQAGAERVKQSWDWKQSGAKALERLRILQQTPLKTTAKESVANATSPPTKQEETSVQRDTRTRLEPAETRSPEGDANSSHEQAQTPVTDRRAVARGKHKPEGKAARVEVKFQERAHPKLSLCMIVKNEERVLEACLRSVKPFVDEIILVDTGSTDRTIEIASKLGAKVYHFPWCDDFSAARNVSLSHATGDWLFWMDADDTLPEACGRGLRDLLFLAEDHVTGYLMQVHIPPAPGEIGMTIVDHVKVFRNRPELRFTRRIHEQILESINAIGGLVQRTDLYVVHSGYDYSPEGQQRKRERDLTILALELKERPDDPFTLHNIGMTAHHLRDFDTAIPALERCLVVTKPHESIVRKVYALLASSYLGQGDLLQARCRVEEGLALFPRDPELLFRAGAIALDSRDLALAERCYITLLTARETGHIDSLDVTMTGFKARHNLALVYQQMGRLADAEGQFQEGLRENPTFVPSWLGLAELLLQMRRFEDARGVAERIQEFAPEASATLRQRIDAATGTPGA